MIGLILTLFHHSGVLVIPGQNRLTPQRRMEVTEWFGRPYNREGGGKFDDIPTVDTRVQNISGGAELAPHSDVQDYPIPPDVTVPTASRFRRPRREGARCSPISFKPMTNSMTRRSAASSG